MINGHFVIHCFVTAVLWSILHLSYSSEAIMRLDFEILLKLSPPTLLAGSAPATQLGKWPRGCPRTEWSDYISKLAWSHPLRWSWCWANRTIWDCCWSWGVSSRPRAAAPTTFPREEVGRNMNKKMNIRGSIHDNVIRIKPASRFCFHGNKPACLKMPLVTTCCVVLVHGR